MTEPWILVLAPTRAAFDRFCMLPHVDVSRRLRYVVSATDLEGMSGLSYVELARFRERRDHAAILYMVQLRKFVQLVWNGEDLVPYAPGAAPRCRSRRTCRPSSKGRKSRATGS